MKTLGCLVALACLTVGGVRADMLTHYSGAVTGYVDYDTIRGWDAPIGSVWHGTYSYHSTSVDGLFTPREYLPKWDENGMAIPNLEQLTFSFEYGPYTHLSFDPDQTWLKVSNGGSLLSFEAGWYGNRTISFHVTDNAGTWLDAWPNTWPLGVAYGRLVFELPQAENGGHEVPEHLGSGWIAAAFSGLLLVTASVSRRSRVDSRPQQTV